MMDTFISEAYFNWLKSETFVLKTEQRNYEGILRLLHDIPFTWIIHADDNRSGDAVTFRQFEFLDRLVIPKDTNMIALGQWATAAPSVLEVLLGCARRWSFYFDEFEASFFFTIMFKNMGFNQFVGRNLTSFEQDEVRELIDIWITRQFESNGIGSPWPLVVGWREHVDQRHVDIWAQMNAYSAEHFQ